jgi:type IV secretory pathway VirB4 component
MASNSTKELVDIAGIRDDVVVLKNGSLRAILEVSAINFDLRSNDEQIAIIQSFQNFLNSIDFSLQIVVNSRRLDLTEYIQNLETIVGGLENELLKIQASEYVKFVTELSDLSNIMAKKFYVVIPYYTVTIPTKGDILDKFKNLFGKKPQTTVIDEASVDKYRPDLKQRVDLVIDNLSGLGLKTKVVSGNDLINIFYQLYNPDAKTKLLVSN